MKTHRTPALAPILVALACLVAAAPLQAQTDPGPWVPLDPSPPGTAAEVMFDVAASSATDSFFDVFLHGFYSPTRIGPDGLTYREVNVPGLGSIGETGAPALPAVGITLAVPTDAAEVTLSQYLPGPIVTLPGFLPWPQPIPATDSGSTAEIFIRNPAIYSGPLPQYPLNPGDPSPVINLLPGITGAILKVHPAFWRPGTGELQIAAHIRLSLHHPGSVALRPPAPRTRVWQAQSLCMNWQSTMQFFPIDEESLKGEYLFVRPISYGYAILPLWSQKQDRGFRCSNVFTDIVGSSCAAIRTAIQNWYALHPNKEHYVLLIGDTETIPLCQSPVLGYPPVASATDDLYGTVDGDNISKEIHVGRLSVSSVSDCSQQIARIVAYEDTPPADQNFGDVVLISNRETSPWNYTNCQEVVRTASYALTPNFQTIYGTNAANDNNSISAAVNQGPGLVCYRGHGDWNKWEDWDQSAESYFNSNVAGLTNQPWNPVVWSIACKTADLSQSDCFGEVWMNLNKHGAVSFYGATNSSVTPDNDILDKSLFRAVYDKDAPDQAWAIEAAEHECSVKSSAINPWMYLLLGDPQMRIRRESVGSGPAQLTSGTTVATATSLTVIPPTAPPIGCADFNCCPTCTAGILYFRVLGPGGVPVPGIKVAVWKGIPPAPEATSSDEVSELLDNRYTDAAGWVAIPTPPLTAGMIHYTATDDREFSMADSLAVTSTSGVAGAGEFGDVRVAAVPSVTRGATRIEFSRPLSAASEVQVFGVDGRRVRTLAVGAGDRAVVWSGDMADGGRAPSGLYFVRLRDRRNADARVIVLN